MTLEQKRAKLAFEQVAEVKKLEEKEQLKYRTATLKAQTIIRNSGLCQALHFINNRDEQGKKLIENLEAHLCVRSELKGGLLENVRTADLKDYLAWMREILATLTWQCRAVEALDLSKKETKS